ncbi:RIBONUCLEASE P SUBUNIT P38 [Salix purpurea]|uniref:RIBONUCLEASE P SUBUNIT P38 n=1 Tax=Salix purpurea TaxID=77065 RepID=A0A9Q0VXA2_SALPP|nr:RIBONUCLEASE P SUBUNIT P38 [Salix purpurea]
MFGGIFMWRIARSPLPRLNLLLYVDSDKERLFVWPWTGVVANIRTQVKDGRRESGSKLRDELATKGFDHLRKNGGLKTRNGTTQSLIKVMDQKDSMVKSYNEGHEKATQQLLAKREELVKCEKQLQQREVQNECERSKLLLEKKMREKEKLHKKITELEKKLDAKQALELRIECMKNALQVMKHMGEDEGLDIKARMETIRQELKEKEEESNGLEEPHQALTVQELKINDELQKLVRS